MQLNGPNRDCPRTSPYSSLHYAQPNNNDHRQHTQLGVHMSFSRRSFVKGAAGVAAIASLPALKGCAADSAGAFRHGVASGDPLADRVIIWTRITPDSDGTSTESADYSWRIALDPGMQAIITEGSGTTTTARDLTVKIDVTGLTPDTTYYYQFRHGSWLSDIGRTKTLPVGSVDHLRIAFTSCSWYTIGYFNVYKGIAERRDLDVVLHLGDYIYEYGQRLANPLLPERQHKPNRDIVSLSDYRERHAQYKTDPHLQEAHRQHPFITVWDDHESANNAWQDGAENHDPSQQGSWAERRARAIQAYFEWMPIRETGLDDRADQLVYRNFRFGDLLNLSMLDTRLTGRDEQAQLLDRETIKDPNRSLLGETQEAWLHQQLSDAQTQGVTWKLLGQQVMMAQLVANEVILNEDQWDGYPAARQRLFDHLKNDGIENFGVLTGDIHTSWAANLQENPFRNTDILGVEFVTPSVTSPASPEKVITHVVAEKLNLVLPHMHYVDLHYHGYVLLDIKHQSMQAEWHFAKSILIRDAPCFFSRAYRTDAGRPGLYRVFRASSSKPSAPFAPEMSIFDKMV